MTRFLQIVVMPQRLGKRGTRWRAWLADGETLLESARTPFYDGARELLRRGYAPEVVLEMRHKGSAIVAMRQTIGAAAKLTVLESDSEGPVIRRWRPFPGVRGEAGTGDDG